MTLTEKFKVGNIIVAASGCCLGFGKIVKLTYVSDQEMRGDILDPNDINKVISISQCCTCLSALLSCELYNPNKSLIKTNIMTKLNSMMKRLLDSDTKELIEAGFIDGDLKLTIVGQEALSAILFDANKAELVKAAKEFIAETKENK